jgi:hypothetical protein
MFERTAREMENFRIPISLKIVIVIWIILNSYIIRIRNPNCNCSASAPIQKKMDSQQRTPNILPLECVYHQSGNVPLSSHLKLALGPRLTRRNGSFVRSLLTASKNLFAALNLCTPIPSKFGQLAGMYSSVRPSPPRSCKERYRRPLRYRRWS